MAWLFPRIYDLLMAPLERGRFRPIRERLLASAQGRVLEIGSGTGVNFPLFRTCEQVVALEPDAVMNRKAARRAAVAAVPIQVVSASAERLPFANASFDSIVATLVLCTIPCPVPALTEMLRVLKPGGTLLAFEHVRLDHPLAGRLQDGLTPLWKHLCGGCHLNRQTEELIRQAGFQVRRIDRLEGGLFIVLEANRSLQ